MPAHPTTPLGGNGRPRPNIIRFISDDTGLEMLGYGGGEVLTPSIDSIARDGRRFDSFYCASSVCVASRYAMLTGHYCGRCPSDQFLAAYPGHEPHRIGFNTHILPDKEKTLGHVLQLAGYRTGYVGKWHTGPREVDLGLRWFEPDDDPRDPGTAARLLEHQQALCAQVRRNGFDYAAAISWGNPQPGDRQIRELEVHNLEWMTRAALDFITQCASAGQPFFLNYAFTTIHGNGHIESLLTDPRLTPEGYRDRHLGCQATRASIYERLRDTGLDFNYITAGALWMDDAIAAVMALLRDLGLDDDTIVAYTADHGPCEGKATCYERGVRIPCVMRWPGHIPAGSVSDAFVHDVDWAPTLARIAGAQPPPDMVLDGRSFLEVALGDSERVEDRDDVFVEYGYARALRAGRYKYIAYRLPERLVEQMKQHQTPRAFDQVGTIDNPALALTLRHYPHYFDPEQLYDLERDPGEKQNLAHDPAHRATLARMHRGLERHLRTFRCPFDLEHVDPFFYSEDFRRLTQGMDDLRPLEQLAWWRNHWR